MFEKRKYTLVLLLAILAGGLYLRGIGLTNPWGEHWDGWGGGFYSNIARNYIMHGYGATGFLPIVNGGDVRPDEFLFYANHPPLLGILVSFSYRLFGITEWAGRLVPLIFSLLSILLLFFIGRKAGGLRLALLAAFLFAVMPRTVLYGTHLDPQGQLVTASTLCVLLGYLLHLDRTRVPLGLVLMCFGLALGAPSDWAAFYIFGFLFLHYYLIRKERGFTILLLCLCCVALFCLFHLYVHLALQGRPTMNAGFLNSTMARIWGLHNTDPARILSNCMIRGFTFLGVPYLVLLVGWITVSLLPGRIRRQPVPGRLPILLLLGVGFIHVAIFPAGASVHEYWFIYLGPGVCLAGASLIEAGLRQGAPRFVRSAGIFVLAGLAGLAVHSWQAVSAQRAEWNTNVHKVFGEEIRNRTPARSLVFIPSNPTQAMNYYADREVHPLLPTNFSKILSLLDEEDRPGYLIIYTKSKKELRTRYKPYMRMMKAGGFSSDVEWVDGYSIFLMKPATVKKNRNRQAEEKR